MAIRDYWVYQKRQANAPWAIHFVKEYDRRKGMSATVLDWTIFNDNIENDAHSKSRVGVHAETLDGYVNEVVTDLIEITVVDSSDVDQLEEAILRILLN